MGDGSKRDDRHVAVLGDTFVDLYCPLENGSQLPFWGGDVLLKGGVSIKSGGSASNTAAHLANLANERLRGIGTENSESLPSKPVSFHTIIGSDTLGQIVTSTHERAGTLLHAAELAEMESGHATGTCVVISGEKDRAFMSSHGIMDCWRREHLDEIELGRASHLHVGGYFNFAKELQAALPALVNDLRHKNPSLTVSLDIGYDASETWGWRAGCDRTNDVDNVLLSLLKVVDVFLPNEDEARGMSGCQDDDEAALSWLCKRVKPGGAVVLTLGAQGALFKYNSDDEPGPKVSRVVDQGSSLPNAVQRSAAPVVTGADLVDSTGAGDAFNAAFLFSWALQGESFPEAIKVALLGGSSAVMHAGACEKLLTAAMLETTKQRLEA